MTVADSRSGFQDFLVIASPTFLHGNPTTTLLRCGNWRPFQNADDAAASSRESRTVKVASEALPARSTASQHHYLPSCWLGTHEETARQPMAESASQRPPFHLDSAHPSRRLAHTEADARRATRPKEYTHPRELSQLGKWHGGQGSSCVPAPKFNTHDAGELKVCIPRSPAKPDRPATGQEACKTVATQCGKPAPAVVPGIRACEKAATVRSSWFRALRVPDLVAHWEEARTSSTATSTDAR